MSLQSFSLVPFSSCSDLKLQGEIKRHKNVIEIFYYITGNLDQIVLKSLSDEPFRKDDLWESTCFEAFLKIPNTNQYWEFNLSPTGDWNMYRFRGYREGMETEKNFNDFAFQLHPKSKAIEVHLSLELNEIIAPEQPLEVAITSVIELQNGELTYWALSHPEKEADFHHSEGFQIML